MVRQAGKKRRRSTSSPSGWERYTGSSAHVNAAIAEQGIKAFTFTVLSQHTGKGDLRYAEFMEQVLRRTLTDNTYYNRQYEAIRYIPKCDPDNEYHYLAVYKGD